MRIHHVGPHEHDLHKALGALTIGAYLPLHPEFVEDGYAEELADIAGRVANASFSPRCLTRATRSSAA